MRFAGKVALVTGGSGGIGAAICRALANEGADVAVHYYQNKQAAIRVRDELIESGRRAIVVQADVIKRSDVYSMISEVKEKLGRIDILVNNAGANSPNVIEEISESEWDWIIDANLKSLYLCCQAVLPHMRAAGWGRIINIGSIAGMRGSASVHYAASKAGVMGFTMALAREVGSFGITVNAIAPGMIDTRMLRESIPDCDEEAKKTTVFGRVGRPEEIALAVISLAMNEYITGETLIVSGGRFMTC